MKIIYSSIKNRCIAAAMIAVMLFCFFLPPVNLASAADTDEAGEEVAAAEISEDKTRIKAIIPYVTKKENGISHDMPVSSREDMTLNSGSVFLKFEIYINSEDAAKYSGLDISDIYIFKLQPHQDISDITSMQPLENFKLRSSEAFNYDNVNIPNPDLYRLESGEIYNKYVLGIKTGEDAYEPVSEARYISDINALSDRRSVPPVSKSKKGLSVQMPGEARMLGVEYTTVNMFVNDFMVAEKGDGENENIEVYRYAGEDYYFDIGKISEYDEKIKYFTNEGINVTAVLLIDAQRFTPSSSGNTAQDEPEKTGENPEDGDLPQSAVPVNPVEYMIHPNALASAHSGSVLYYGINATDEQGIKYFEALMSFIAVRYVRGDASKFGRIYNIVLGADIGYCSIYNYCGEIDIVSYVENYLRALRICDAAVRSSFGGGRVYVPFDNWFAYQPPGDEDFINKDIIDLLCEYSRKEGNFIWNIAWSAQNFAPLNPAVWRETEPADDFSTPVITMKNISVLCDYINVEKKDYLPGGESRKVILMDQGFSSCDNSAENKELQAAAFVYAYLKAKYLPDITAFIYYCHVDNRNDVTGFGGGSFGLWTTAPDTVNAPGEKKLIYDVFKYIDTNMEAEKIGFAKDILGISGFEEIARDYSADAAHAVILKEVTGETLKSKPNSTSIGLFNNSGFSGFLKTSNVSVMKSVKYENPDSENFNKRAMLFTGFSAPVKGDFGGIFKIYAPEDTQLNLDGAKYVGARLRIDTSIDMPEDQKIQLVLIMESELSPQNGSAGQISIFEGLANISPNRDEIVYFDISSWTEREEIKRIKLLVNPYADSSSYKEHGGDGDKDEYDFNLYVYSIVSARGSQISWIQILLTVALIIIIAGAVIYGILFIRAKTLKKRRREQQELQRKHAKAAAGRKPGIPGRPNPNQHDRNLQNYSQKQNQHRSLKPPQHRPPPENRSRSGNSSKQDPRGRNRPGGGKGEE